MPTPKKIVRSPPTSISDLQENGEVSSVTGHSSLASGCRPKGTTRVGVTGPVMPSPHQLPHQRLDLLPHLRLPRGEEDVRLEPIDRVADVVALRVEHHAVYRLAREEQLQRVRELDLAALAGLGLVEALVN